MKICGNIGSTIDCCGTGNNKDYLFIWVTWCSWASNDFSRWTWPCSQEVRDWRLCALDVNSCLILRIISGVWLSPSWFVSNHCYSFSKDACTHHGCLKTINWTIQQLKMLKRIRKMIGSLNFCLSESLNLYLPVDRPVNWWNICLLQSLSLTTAVATFIAEWLSGWPPKWLVKYLFTAVVTLVDHSIHLLVGRPAEWSVSQNSSDFEQIQIRVIN